MSKKLLQAAAGNAGEALYVEDVFSTYLYTGNGTSQTITNDIDLAGEGGLVWSKSRSVADNHRLTDTERGANKTISTDASFAEYTNVGVQSATQFNSDGFVSGLSDSFYNGESIASWTFRKAPKFFDVVTYTGDGVAGRTVAHNLEVAPAFIIIKCTSTPTNWPTYHASNDWAGFPAENTSMYLNLDLGIQVVGNLFWNGTAPTSTEFTVGSSAQVNSSGETYVAYLFASDAGGFGDDDESIIKCGSYTGVSTGVEVDLGFEPQWVLVKPSSIAGNWDMADVMRGATAEKTATFDGSWAELTANTSAAEIARDATITPRPTGMFIKDNGLSNNGETYIYIAIRRPMKTPESGTEVFAIDQWDGATTLPTAKSGFPVDMAIWKDIDGSDGYAADRMRGRVILRTNTTGAETSSSAYGFDYQNGYLDVASNDATRYSWMFKRATGFFDVVAYTGDGVAGRTVTHNLGVTPEFMIIKRRSGVAGWVAWSKDLTQTGTYGPETMYLDVSNAPASNGFLYASPTASSFSLDSYVGTNGNGDTYIAYLFATVAGVSKVGSYTGTGSNINVDCGFSAGARFILIKRTDSTGDWYVWDSERGIVAGNDPYLLLNSTAAEVTSTDYIDPLSSGFTVTSSAAAALNASGGTYIYLSIA